MSQQMMGFQRFSTQRAPLPQIQMMRAHPTPGFQHARFAMSRNLSHEQFGTIYERDPEKKRLPVGHFTGGIIYHVDSPAPGRAE